MAIDIVIVRVLCCERLPPPPPPSPSISSPLHGARQRYQPRLPGIFAAGMARITLSPRKTAVSVARRTVDSRIRALFPHTYRDVALICDTHDEPAEARPIKSGVILSGGQAPGGHSVICGLFDALIAFHPQSEVIGFLNGPAGLLKCAYRPLTASIIDQYRHSGGFDMIGSGRTKIENEAQFAQALQVCTQLELDAVVVIGGDDSNTNAALMAEYFCAHNARTVVVGVPKTIDGDLRNEYIPISFGFDTATKTYSELVGNICRDANSAQKYWHFIRLMGRSASHIALECALQTRANICVISEEVARKRQRLGDLVAELTAIIIKRAKAGKNYGVALIPEGLIEFISEMRMLIDELNELLATHADHIATLGTFEDQAEFINRKLTMEQSYVFSALPSAIQRQLLLDRDPHGNVQVSRIDTEQLLIEMINDAISELPAQERAQVAFSAQHHFFGYEGRAAYPTNFDTDYCYALGYSACALIINGHTGYMAIIDGVQQSDRDAWRAGATPITTMMVMERRHGSDKAVIEKGLVDLDGAAFRYFSAQREAWAEHSDYRAPGAIQYYGAAELCDSPPISLQLEG